MEDLDDAEGTFSRCTSPYSDYQFHFFTSAAQHTYQRYTTRSHEDDRPQPYNKSDEYWRRPKARTDYGGLRESRERFRAKIAV